MTGFYASPDGETGGTCFPSTVFPCRLPASLIFQNAGAGRAGDPVVGGGARFLLLPRFEAEFRPAAGRILVRKAQDGPVPSDREAEPGQVGPRRARGQQQAAFADLSVLRRDRVLAVELRSVREEDDRQPGTVFGGEPSD